MKGWLLALVAILTTACAPKPPVAQNPSLQITWHLLRQVDVSKREDGRSSSPDALASSGEETKSIAAGSLVRHRLYLTLINSGTTPLKLPSLTVVGGNASRPYPAPTQALPPGGVRVIDLEDFDCWLPVKVVLDGGGEVPVPLLPSGFPEDLDRRCPWPDAEPAP